MILKGNSRANGRDLALHLLNARDNEHVKVHELGGFLTNDLMEAFQEVEAISLGTKCQQYLFSLSLSPPTSANVSVGEFETAIANIERRLGLAGQPRAIVFHEKKGRRHAHCVWSRINVSKMRAINLPHFKRRLTDISRELYLEHGWEMPAGLRNHEERNPNSYSHAEAGQAKRVKRNPENLKEMFRSCWASSDSRPAFSAALSEQGFCLARGDRRGFVAVDANGEIYSLSRWCGVKSKELRARLGDGIDLPDVEEAIALLAGRPPQLDPDQAFHRQINDHETKIASLVSRQRLERQSLSEAQESRRLIEAKDTQSRLPKGFKATWARLTGSYQKLLDSLAQEAQDRKTGNRAETQSLIDRHLAERRLLDQELNFLRAQHALETEFREASQSPPPQTYDPDPRQPLVLPREDAPFTPNQLKRKPDLILAHISDKQARFSRNDVMRGLAEFIIDPLELRVAANRALASPELVRLTKGADTEFTTRDFQDTQYRLSSCATEMVGSGGFRVKPAHIECAIKHENAKLERSVGANLSAEQVTAIHHILGSNQLSAVVGLAGTGKSTLLSVARAAWERQGFRVHGAALAGKAADSLQSASGIPSRTLASLEASWKNGYEPVGPGDVVVIDEAGMVGTRQLERVAEQLRMRGCKLVLVGDPDQLQPIQAGTPFREITTDNGAARLSEIRRQKSNWQRQASRDLADGHVKTAMQSYADYGAVHETQNRDHAITALVNDYMADWQATGPGKSRLALAHRRKDVHAINQAIKSARVAQSETTPEVMFDTNHGPRTFTAGDRILFTSNDRDLGVRNGMLATVETIGGERLTVRFDADEVGQRSHLTFSPLEFPAIDHGFAVTIHRAQGCTVDRSFVLASRTLDKNLTYVALTRHRQETGFYTAPDIAKHRDMTFEPKMFAPRGFRTKAPTRGR